MSDRPDATCSLLLDVFLPLVGPHGPAVTPSQLCAVGRPVLSMAERLGLSALLYHRLVQHDLIDVYEASVQEYLRAAHAREAARCSAIRQVLGPLLGWLSENVQLIVLKGAAFAHTVYPEPHLRPISDVDLLLPRDDVRRTEELLTERGFRPPERQPRDHGPCLQRQYVEGVCVYLELHDTMVRGGYPTPSWEQVSEPSQLADVFGARVHVPDNRLGAAHAAARLVIGLPMGELRYLVDFVHALARCESPLDELRSLARGLGWEGMFCAAAALSGEELSPALSRRVRWACSRLKRVAGQASVGSLALGHRLQSKVAGALILDHWSDIAMRAAHGARVRLAHPLGR